MPHTSMRGVVSRGVQKKGIRLFARIPAFVESTCDVSVHVLICEEAARTAGRNFRINSERVVVRKYCVQLRQGRASTRDAAHRALLC